MPSQSLLCNLASATHRNFADPVRGNNAEAAEVLAGNEVITYLDTPIGRRKAFPNAASEGRGVCELKRQDPKASAEMAALVHAIIQRHLSDI